MPTGYKSTTEQFIRQAKEIHGDKYDYSMVEYVKSKLKVTIICPIHGQFKQTPNAHLRGNGCNLCGIESRTSQRTYNKEEFIANAVKRHGDKYDYSKVVYHGSCHKVCIVCHRHGDFWQEANNHLRGAGCPHCYHSNQKRLVCGIGINDVEYCPKEIYQKWISMIKRCYSDKLQRRSPTYIGCAVCQEWLCLSNFKEWYEHNGIDGYALDKDILVKGNRIYSPDTCCFVPNEINILMCEKSNRKYAKGISCFRKGRYLSSICIYSKKVHLGCFKTELEAFFAYKNAKEKYVKELAEKYFKEGKITERVYNALMKYEVVD